MRLYIGLVVASVVINFVVSLALVHPLGIEGVIVGTLAGNLLITPLLIMIFLQEFALTFGEWVRGVIVPLLPGVAAQALTAAPLLWLALQSPTLPVVAIAGLASVGSALLAFALFGMRRPERVVLADTLRAALGLRLRES